MKEASESFEILKIHANRRPLAILLFTAKNSTMTNAFRKS